MKNIRLLVSVVLVTLAHIMDAGTSTDGFESRRQLVLTSLRDVPLDKVGKYGLPQALGRLANDPRDALALDYITNSTARLDVFDSPNVALALMQFRDSFGADRLRRIEHNLTSGSMGFMGHGTENHAIMRWVGGYLYAQAFPAARWRNGMTSEQLMTEMRERLRVTLRGVYHKGYAEHLSTSYDVVMNVPMMTLHVYAEDPRMRDIALAYLLYKWPLSALNNFEGHIMAPYARMNSQQDLDPGPGTRIPSTSLFNWLYWGWGESTGNIDAQEIRTIYASAMIPATLLRLRPPDSIFALAGKPAEPFLCQTSGATFGELSGPASRPQALIRQVYRTGTYAVGTGNFRWVPGGHYADHDANGFNIVWSTRDRFNYLESYHPFWFSDVGEGKRTADSWAHGTISPFQQAAQHKGSAILLYSIPEADPWPNQPSPEKWGWRDSHAASLLKRVMIRYPNSVDQTVEENGWIFLKEGDTYVAIRPLRAWRRVGDEEPHAVEHFRIIETAEPRTGFVFEVSARDEVGGFDAFRARVRELPVIIDWDQMTVEYRTLSGDRLRLAYKVGLPLDPDGLANAVPHFEVNGQPETDYTKWPLLSGPGITMKDGILTIKSLGELTRVDWTGDYPIIVEKAGTEK